MAEIGRKGFETLVARHFMGDKQAALNWLHGQMNEAALQRAAQAKLDSGETCVEIPCALHPDDDPGMASHSLPTHELNLFTESELKEKEAASHGATKSDAASG